MSSAKIAAWRSLAVLALAGALASTPALATADGPDYFRMRGIPDGHYISLRAEPSVSAARLARLPADATCVRNLGCRGGLTLEEFTTLPEEEQRRRAQSRPLWCKVDHLGAVGWVLGKYLAEGDCPAAAAKQEK